MKARSPDRNHRPRQLITDPIEQPPGKAPSLPREHEQDAPRSEIPADDGRFARASMAVPAAPGERDPDNVNQESEDADIERDPP